MTSGVNAISGIAWKSAKESAHRPEPQTSSKPGRPPDLKFWRGMMHLKWHLECRHKERNKWDDWLVKARIPAVRNSNHSKSRGSVGSWWSKALLHATRFGSRFTYKKGKKKQRILDLVPLVGARSMLNYGWLMHAHRRKFRSQTSDNMERWKAEQGRGREKRKIRREKIRRGRVRRQKYRCAKR